MSPDTPISGWHATDDEQSVPVRSSAPAAAAPVGPAHDIGQTEMPHLVLAPAATAPNPASMKLSAFLGIAVVLGGLGFYFGFGNIFGDLIGDAATEISITPAGEFSPVAVTLHPGDTFTITNDNADPQVLKSKDGRDLFPVQVIFDKPYTFTIPTTADGEYVYFSETLPEDKLLTITVTANTATSSSSVQSSVSDIDIPLPFGDTPLSVSSSSSSASSISSSVSSAAPVVVVEPTEHSNEPATISLTGASSSAATNGGGSIPVNPYTVASGLSKQSQSEAIANENLHSGAPLNEIRQHTPRSVTETGPAGMLVLVVPALVGVGLLYRKLRLI